MCRRNIESCGRCAGNECADGILSRVEVCGNECADGILSRVEVCGAENFEELGRSRLTVWTLRLNVMESDIVLMLLKYAIGNPSNGMDPLGERQARAIIKAKEMCGLKCESETETKDLK
ncbi:hypothetical protein HNY73_017130 [Argiope bruennichi]|uniref:Uncharacterized protein n=1 Tax=Argiope bruennichi TaxID=94029 RepID=A0A8T0ELX5_ARGBR|nr:hypothetical protein HNY73_017130 [Argiope bruennichi]